MTLLVTTLALGGALLVPLAFSDPNGVDPYVVRLSATSLIMLGAAYASRRLVSGRPVLLAVVAVTASFTLFSAAPQILFDLFKSGSGSGAAFQGRQAFGSTVEVSTDSTVGASSVHDSSAATVCGSGSAT